MNHLSLFSGIGGIDLAAEWTGFETIAFCEIDPYCQKVLEKHWPKVPIIGDIRDVTREKVMAYTNGARGAGQGNNETDRWSRFISGANPQVLQGEQITLLTGGFPCQPFSQAGKRKGSRDDRYLWPEMLRVIREVKPAWVVGENVGGITNLEVGDSVPDLEGEVSEEVFEHNSVVLDRVCTDLEEIGYSVQPFLIPACAVNAPHRRDRVFIVGYATKFSNSRVSNDGECGEHQESAGESGRTSLCEDVAYAINNGHKQEKQGVFSQEAISQKQNRTSDSTAREFDRTGYSQQSNRLEKEQNVADTIGQRGCGGDSQREYAEYADPRSQAVSNGGNRERWTTERRLGRVANGVSSILDGYWDKEPGIPRVTTGQKNRVDRLKCLGNAVVPQQIYPILKAIAEIEGHRRLSYVTK